MSEIWHHGILGMKWGIRRFQNKDGSLTAAGRKRYLNEDGSLTEKGSKELPANLRNKYINDRANEIFKTANSEISNVSGMKPGSNEKATAEKDIFNKAEESGDAAVRKAYSDALRSQLGEKFGDARHTHEYKSKEMQADIRAALEKYHNLDDEYRSMLSNLRKPYVDEHGVFKSIKDSHSFYDIADNNKALQKLKNDVNDAYEGFRNTILRNALKSINFDVSDYNLEHISDFVFRI